MRQGKSRSGARAPSLPLPFSLSHTYTHIHINTHTYTHTHTHTHKHKHKRIRSLSHSTSLSGSAAAPCQPPQRRWRASCRSDKTLFFDGPQIVLDLAGIRRNCGTHTRTCKRRFGHLRTCNWALTASAAKVACILPQYSLAHRTTVHLFHLVGKGHLKHLKDFHLKIKQGQLKHLKDFRLKTKAMTLLCVPYSLRVASCRNTRTRTASAPPGVEGLASVCSCARAHTARSLLFVLPEAARVRAQRARASIHGPARAQKTRAVLALALHHRAFVPPCVERSKLGV